MKNILIIISFQFSDLIAHCFLCDLFVIKYETLPGMVYIYYCQYLIPISISDSIDQENVSSDQIKFV